MTVPVGLIGYGLGGAVFHAPLIRACEGLALAGIATSRPVPAGERAVADPRALIDDPAIALIVVTAPNPLHFPLAKAALEAGKHVVIDKPFAATVAEADALIALARECGRLVVPFHNRRWDGDFLSVRRLLESGRLGEVLLAELHWDRFRLETRPGWKDAPARGVGLIYDLGSHLVDQALLLFGSPERVSADIATQRPGGTVDDYFALTLAYGRRRVILSASTVVATPRPRFALHGTAGSFVKFGLDPQEALLKAGARPTDPGFGAEAVEAHGLLATPEGATERIATERGDYLAFYQAVAAAIGDGAPPPVDPIDARAGLAIIEAACLGRRDD